MTLKPYIQLMRLDKPIGAFLLLWPTLQAIFISSHNHPSWRILFGFTLGTWLMRSAGCVANDMADKSFDRHVKRTANRPIANGTLRRRQAVPLLLVLLTSSASLLFLYNLQTFFWAIPAVVLALSYPFMKRWINFPQVVLGAAFSWSIPMAFVASGIKPELIAFLLFFFSLLWVIAYDTEYAMVDRDDDVRIGVRSTAILFGKYDVTIIVLLQAIYLIGMIALGSFIHLNIFFYLIMPIIAYFFVKQYVLIRTRDRMQCFTAFLANNRVGMVMTLAIYLGLFRI